MPQAAALGRAATSPAGLAGAIEEDMEPTVFTPPLYRPPGQGKSKVEVDSRPKRRNARDDHLPGPPHGKGGVGLSGLARTSVSPLPTVLANHERACRSAATSSLVMLFCTAKPPSRHRSMSCRDVTPSSRASCLTEIPFLAMCRGLCLSSGPSSGARRGAVFRTATVRDREGRFFADDDCMVCFLRRRSRNRLLSARLETSEHSEPCRFDARASAEYMPARRSEPPMGCRGEPAT